LACIDRKVECCSVGQRQLSVFGVAGDANALSARSGADLNLIARDANIEGVDRKPRIVGPFAVAHAESPGMPRASDDALVVEVACTQGCAHVRAQVVDRQVVALVQKDRHKPVANLKRTPLPFRYRADFGHRDEPVV
jgi:hypothetical protein